MKATFEVSAQLRAAYLYTCYAATMVLILGTAQNANIKLRLLTNWPDIDPLADVQAFSTGIFTTGTGSDNDFTQPKSGPDINLVGPLDRFLLLFDPRPLNTAIQIAELEVGANTGVGVDYSAELYGYFWDRSVLNAPGGPRHPGSA